MRYTRKFIDARFAMAMDALGLPHGETWARQSDGRYLANVGTYFIDQYNGYQIACMHNEGGAQSTPFGSTRYKAAEFVALLDGILGSARILKGN